MLGKNESRPQNNNEEIASVFEKIISGLSINETINGWDISNSISPKIIELFRSDGSAIFGFEIQHEDDATNFINYHREARTGNGSDSLIKLEDILKILAKKTNKIIRLVFPKFNQEDTAKWLEKNNYIYNEVDDVYYKEIT